MECTSVREQNPSAVRQTDSTGSQSVESLEEVVRILKSLEQQNRNFYRDLNRSQGVNARPISGRPFLAALHSPKHRKSYDRADNGRGEDFSGEVQLPHFQTLKQRFYEKTGNSSRQGLRLPVFLDIMQEALQGLVPLESATTLFNKMDSQCRGQVSWDDVSNFLLSRTESVSLVEPKLGLFDGDGGKQSSTPHKDLIVRMDYIARERKYLTVSRDGVVCLWSPQLNLFRTVNLAETMARSVWVVDAAYLHDHSKLAIALDSRVICLVDILALQPRCVAVVGQLEYSPTCISYSSEFRENESLILFGDTEGNVSVLHLLRKFFLESASENASAQLYENLSVRQLSRPNALETLGACFKTFRVHKLWVNRVSFSSALGVFVSCASEEHRSFAFGDIERGSLSYLAVNKGVRTFAFASKPAMLIAGGRDKMIRLWNPFVLTKSAGTLIGHNTAIANLEVHSRESLVISCSEDRVIKVWSMRTLNCLQTFQDIGGHRPESYISCIYLDILGRRLFCNSSKLNVYCFAVQQPRESVTKQESPVIALELNEEFGQLVSCTASGSVAVWDAASGSLAFKFSATEYSKTELRPTLDNSCTTGQNAGSAAEMYDENEARSPSHALGRVVSAMSLDLSKKLILLGMLDGELRMFNFNIGLLIRRYKLLEPTQVTGVTHVPAPKNATYVVSVGCDRRTFLFLDDFSHSERKKTSDTVVEAFKVIEARSRHREEDHRGDILALVYAKAPKPLLITGGSDGTIVIRDLATFHIDLTLSVAGEGGKPVPSVLFLKLIQQNESFINSESLEDVDNSQLLVSAHTGGDIRVWDYERGELLCMCNCLLFEGEALTALEVDPRLPLVYVGGNKGHVRRLHFDKSEAQGDVFERYWRAHADEITALKVFYSFKSSNDAFVVTASADCTMKIWTGRGEHIGVFSQGVPWSLANCDTWAPLTFNTQVELVLDGVRKNILWPGEKLQPDQAMLLKLFMEAREVAQERLEHLINLAQADRSSNEKEQNTEINETNGTVDFEESDASKIQVSSAEKRAEQAWEVPESLLNRQHETKYFSLMLNGAHSERNANTRSANTNNSFSCNKPISAELQRFMSSGKASTGSRPTTAAETLKGDSIYRNLRCSPLQSIELPGLSPLPSTNNSSTASQANNIRQKAKTGSK